MNSDIDINKIRRRVEKRLKDRQEVVQHVTVYIIVNVFLWILYFATNRGGSSIPWPLWATFGWGIGVVSHVVGYLGKANQERAVADAVEREIELERARRGLDPMNYGKAKRKNGSYRLTDDGELAEDPDYDETDSRRAARL